jgi:hypothetical protein
MWHDMISAHGTILDHPIWMNEMKRAILNLHMPYKWQCVIGGIVIANNGDWLNLIIRSNNEVSI